MHLLLFDIRCVRKEETIEFLKSIITIVEVWNPVEIAVYIRFIVMTITPQRHLKHATSLFLCLYYVTRKGKQNIDGWDA